MSANKTSVFEVRSPAQVQIVGDHLKKLAGIDAALNTKANSVCCASRKPRGAFEHRRLASPDFTREDYETLAGLDSVDEGQRLFMLLAAVEQVGSGLRLNGLAENPKNALPMNRA